MSLIQLSPAAAPDADGARVARAAGAAGDTRRDAASAFLRAALAAAFLSAVADRFGLWGPAGAPAVA